MKEYIELVLRRDKEDLERLNAKAQKGWRVICCVTENDEYHTTLILERNAPKQKVKP